MKKPLLVLLVFLSGCVTNPVDPNIPPNVVLSAPEAYDARYIQTIHFEFPDTNYVRSPSRCIALIVNNSEYTLTDSSKSFVGQYTGNFYNIDNQRQVGGGQSLVYSDDTSAIASGSVDGTFVLGLATIKKIVKFKVEAQTSQKGILINFTNIQAAQKSTGYAKNDGFNKVGAWPGAKPVFVYNLLKDVASNIHLCIVNS